MKSLTLFLAFALAFFCFSCKQNSPKVGPPKKHEVPKSLQNDNKDFSLITKRGGGDNLLEAIYADLLKNHSDLRSLEDRRAHFNDGLSDSLKEFNDYDSKSGNYYSSAFEGLDRIKDTVLRQRLRLLLANSQKNYAEKTSKYKSLIKQTDIDRLTAADYYLTLKIATTLPIMEDFQVNNLPDGKSINAIANESGKLLQHTKKLAEKYGDRAANNK